MEGRWATKFASLALAATVVITGCATVSKSRVRDTERLLVAAGFTVQRADTAEHRAHLEAMPAYRLLSHIKDGAVEYTYADPEHCKCVYVGSHNEYLQYARLATEVRIAREQLWPCLRDLWMDCGPWATW